MLTKSRSAEGRAKNNRNGSKTKINEEQLRELRKSKQSVVKIINDRRKTKSRSPKP